MMAKIKLTKDKTNKVVKSRIFGNEWTVSDKSAISNDETVTYLDDDVFVDDEGEDNYVECKGRKIPYSPRGYVISNKWYPTHESVFAILDKNPNKKVQTYDEAIE
jgi:hypothetical protein